MSLGKTQDLGHPVSDQHLMGLALTKLQPELRESAGPHVRPNAEDGAHASPAPASRDHRRRPPSNGQGPHGARLPGQVQRVRRRPGTTRQIAPTLSLEPAVPVEPRVVATEAVKARAEAAGRRPRSSVRPRRGCSGRGRSRPWSSHAQAQVQRLREARPDQKTADCWNRQAAHLPEKCEEARTGIETSDLLALTAHDPTADIQQQWVVISGSTSHMVRTRMTRRKEDVTGFGEGDTFVVQRCAAGSVPDVDIHVALLD